jgi:uncharacterized protein GlcG (DUF336 family)
MCSALLCYGKVKLEEIPRLDTSTALKILTACHQESLNQKVNVAIIVVGIDGRILAVQKVKRWIQAFMISQNSRHKHPVSKE